MHGANMKKISSSYETWKMQSPRPQNLCHWYLSQASSVTLKTSESVSLGLLHIITPFLPWFPSSIFLCESVTHSLYTYFIYHVHTIW